MRHPVRIVVVPLLILLGGQAQAQVKNMPSQAEFDPILESADSSLKDLGAIFAEFHAEAAQLDAKRLDDTLQGIEQTHKVIASAHSGPANQGINVQRLVAVLSMFDDDTLNAALWKNEAELKMCQQLAQGQRPDRYDQFSTKLAMQLGVLRESGVNCFTLPCEPQLQQMKSWESCLPRLTNPQKRNDGLSFGVPLRGSASETSGRLPPYPLSGRC